MTTKTTLHLSISRGSLALAHVRAWLARRDPLALLVLGLALAIAALLLRPHAAPERIAAVPTPPLPIIMIATAQAEARPTPTIATNAIAAAVLPGTLARASVAYDAPDGRVIGAIDRGHAYQIVARFGVDWLQADVAGSGLVWLRSADLFALPADLVDVAPAAPQYQISSQQSTVDSQPPAPIPGQPPLVLTEAQQAAVDREFGPVDTGGAALEAQQARQDEVLRQQAIHGHYANDHAPAAAPLLTSDDLPCNCP